MGNYFKGLLIIPEGTINKSIKPVGYPYEVSSISHLADTLRYAKRLNYGVLYLSSYYGILYADDIIDTKRHLLYRMPSKQLLQWSLFVSEEIVRYCLEFNVLNILFMARGVKGYSMLLDILRGRNLSVYTPLLGKSNELIKECLCSNGERGY